MRGDIASDWPVYFLLGIVLIFFVYVIVVGNLKQKDKK